MNTRREHHALAPAPTGLASTDLPGPDLLDAIDDDAIALVQALLDGRSGCRLRTAEPHPPGLHLLLRIDDQDVGPSLIDLHGGLRDHQRLFRLLALRSDLGELAGHQHAVRIRELRPHRDRVGPRSTFTSRKLNLPGCG